MDVNGGAPGRRDTGGGDGAGAPGVSLKIGSLSLDGLAPGHRRTIGPAVERELARLLGAHGVPAGLAQAGGSVAGGKFRVSPGASVDAAAAHVARQLYERMRGGRR